MCVFLVPQSCLTLRPPWNSPGKNTGVGCHALFQGIFLTQGSNPGLSHCRLFLYHLSHQGSPRIIPSPADLLDPGIKLGSPALQADSLPTELSGKPPKSFKRRYILVFSSAGVLVRLIWLDCSLKILIFEKVRKKPMISQRLPAAASVKLDTAVHQIPGVEARGTSR